MPTKPKNTDPRPYQSVIRHEGQAKPTRMSVASADTAIGRARDGYDHGAVEAYVVRRTDGVRVYDGPAGIELHYTAW